MTKKASFPAVPVHTFLAYSSLNELSRRMQKRNQETENSGLVTNKRVGFPLMQFASLYKKRVDDTEPMLDSLRREDVDHAFALHYPNEPSKKIEFLNALGFSSPEIKEVKITTRFNLGNTTVVNTTDPIKDLITTIHSKSSQEEKHFLSTYKSLHLGGDDTPESSMIKRMLQTDMRAAFMRYLDLKQSQKNCGPAIMPLD